MKLRSQESQDKTGDGPHRWPGIQPLLLLRAGLTWMKMKVDKEQALFSHKKMKRVYISVASHRRHPI